MHAPSSAARLPTRAGLALGLSVVLALCAVGPLSAQGLTRDAGDIAIIEHDGSNYDSRLEGGALNYEARERVGQRFFETHGDDYDFLVVFTNFDFETEDATAFHMLGRQDVAGLGKPIGSAAPEPFGSRARLKGWIDMASVSQYREAPFSLTPGDLGFLGTLNVLAHEVGHQWLAAARFRDGTEDSEALLGRDGTHWSHLLDSDASLLYGADWRDDGSGSFTALRVKDRYSALDRYLMGFLAPEEVGPLTLLVNPAVDSARISREGDVVSATPTTVLIDQLVAAMGERQPDHRHSQKEFRLGFVFLTAPGTEPGPGDLEAVERVRRAFGPHFFGLTHGVAWADTSLAVLPPAARASVPDLGRALSWLLARQQLDGTWADAPGTSLRDTATVVQALARAGATGPAWQRGLLWLQGARSESLDFAARRDAALAGLQIPGEERGARATTLLSRQNPDGGLGAGLDFASDALDTALALRALRALDHTADARVSAAVAALQVLQGADGGWAAVPGGATSTVVTAEVLLALADWPEVPGAPALQASGLTALVARRNTDGGFGASPSTPFASALALEVLLRTSGPPDLVEPLVAWLQRNQLADGSWAGSPFQTALVLGALSDSLGANLTVPADSLVLTPSPAQEGDIVQVVARVRNTGRADAPPSAARLFDGAPGTSPMVAEAAVPALAQGQEAAVSFDFPTTDRPGARTLFVVADAGEQVPESREDDNTASRALTVVGLLADLVLTPGDIAVSPAAPEIGEAASILVTVANAGERVASEFEVQVTVTDPDDRTTALAPQAVPSLGVGEPVVVFFPWTPAQDGEHAIVVRADARYQVPESDETNGEAERDVEVLEEVPANPELAVGSVIFSPQSVSELPQVVAVSVLVENRGRAAAETTLEIWDDDTGGFLAATDVPIGGRSSEVVVVDVTIETPGDHPLVLTVDPDDDFPEENELDNEAFAVLRGDHTLDIEVLAASPVPPEIEQGETVQVNVELRNRGTLDLFDVPVHLAQETAEGPVELSRTTVDLAPGASTIVSLWWRALASPGDLSLTVRADPFDLLREQREDNNSVPLSLRIVSSGLPNLTASGADVVIDPDPPVEGGTATVSAVVKNTGDAPAGPFRVSVFVGDPDEGGTLLGEAALGGLLPGEGEAVQIPWSPVDMRGSLGLHVLVDPDDEIDESDEDDNLAFRPFVSLGLPDLVLTRAAVILDPAYPREGESVTITTTVRNLGDQPSVGTTLLVTEREPEAEVIGLLTVPPLSPGALTILSLAWTPSSPPGDRPVRVTVDPDDTVVEQDEGNNTAREIVVVQNADLYLTAPFVSPNGDGVLDETTLGWRATVPVTIVATNRRGEPVRTLVENGPESGSLTWDGRDEAGATVLDGSYTLSVTGENGALLAQVEMAVDTNRSPLHDVVGPGETAARNLSCSLPEIHGLLEVAWSPGEDSLLTILRYPGEGWEPGLVRLGLNGGYAYVDRDPWYNQATFVSEAAVSPDGAEVLVNNRGDLFAVDLLSGARRELGSLYNRARWSPDGRWIQVGDRILSRGGDHIADLPGDPYLEWAWSPGSDRLAQGGTVVARDGTVLVDEPLDPEDEYAILSWTVWRGDGLVVAELDSCIGQDVAPGASAPDEEESCRRWFVLDPETGETSTLPVTSWGQPSWSPDGRRFISEAWVFEGDGTPLLNLGVPDSIRVSPRSSAALYSNWRESGYPGTICSDKSNDYFALVTLANLSAHLDVKRLVGNGGFVLWGTATDRHLESFELDYARVEEPGTWHPIGPAFDVPVVDDAFTVWVPEAPGTYLVRLRVRDRAGNETVRTRTVEWNRVASIVNFTQSGYFLSPDGNGVKDEVVFRYMVVEPVRLDLRIVGPEPVSPEGPDPAEVRHETFEFAASGPRSFTWGGENDSAQHVPDGRYTVFLNGLPFHVEVDTTPPELGMRVENARTQQTLHWTELGGACLYPTTIPPRIPAPTTMLGDLYYDQVWHVVDRNLKTWAVHSEYSQGREWSQPVFVTDTNELGEPILVNGMPRVKREGGRPVGWLDTVRGAPRAYERRFVAVDRAGNTSEIVVPPAPESVWHLGAEHECDPLMPAPVEPDPAVHGLAPENVVFKAHTNASTPEGRSSLRLAVQPEEGGSWQEFPASGFDGYFPFESFLEAGIDPTRTWRGRFLVDGAVEELATEDFLFDPCPRFIRAEVEAGILIVEHRLPEPVQEAWATLRRENRDTPGGWDQLGRFRLAPYPELEDRFYLALPDHSCTENIAFTVELFGASGTRYPNEEIPGQCARVAGLTGGDCEFSLSFKRLFAGCEGSPDELTLEIDYFASRPAHVVIEGGPEESPVGLFEVDIPLPMGQPNLVTHVAAVRGVPEGLFHVRGRLVPTSPEFQPVEAEGWFFIDRTPPVGEILAPPEGGTVCLAQAGSGADVLSLLIRAEDTSPEIGLEGLVRSQGGEVRSLNRLCGGRLCDPGDLIRSGAVLDLTWDASFADSGEYGLELRLCDRSGNSGTSTRHVRISREPPSLQVASTTPAVLSPNSDGVSDATTIVVRVAQAGILTAEVHAGSPSGPLVRTLIAGESVAATDVVAVWDGLDDGGIVAPDGAYAIVFRMGDACGGEGAAVAEVEVDTTPPDVAVTEPAGGQRVSASVEVLGQAMDLHLASWELDVACGGTADWTTISSGTRRIPAGTFVAFWDTSRAPPGECLLRLVAEDQAGNRSPEALASALVERGDLIERLFATPAIFSPNGDGRLETAALDYSLAREALVRLELRHEGEVIRTLEADTLRGAGPVTHTWDGRDDLGAAAPDGAYLLWMRAEDPVAPTVYEEETIRVEIDTVSPALNVTRPLPDGVEAPSHAVVGSVEDANLREYVVTATPAGGASLELGRSSLTVQGGNLAPLGHLGDGPHTLRIDASDLAENSSELEISFVVDSIPPTAAIQAPAQGAVLLRGEGPIPIVGLVRDDHLEGWTLRFGPGAEPVSFTPLSEGTEGGNEMSLASWDVRHVPDGVYTLSLTATDLGGLSRESRVTLTLDGQAPQVAIEVPEGGGYVTGPLSIFGSATDTHLASWALEVAPGEGATAWQWTVLGTGTKAVTSGGLADWSPLPEDGVYTLRLRADDEVDLTAATHVTVTVDTTPPATPTGLEADLSPGEEDGYAHVRVSWNLNTEPDLAGYRISSGRGEVEDEPVDEPLWDDGERLEGRYDYRVVAVDHAGNVSAPATLDVLVDLTPPTLAFLSPEEETRVSGAVEVTGTAWSADDFAEYRLLVGEGEAPTTWTLLRRSTVPVAAGRLGDWLALTDGPHVLALEADDIRGNEGRITRGVVVDSQPPAPPVLIDVDHDPPPVDRLVPEWDPSPSEDVEGYLVYRNGRIANAGTVVLGDLRAFLVDDLEHFDDGLPDGEHCYSIVAMDEAGNTSVPSNEICRTLDNRAPQAVIVQPADGTRFGAPLRVVAGTEDLDVATILFERRESGSPDWSLLGERAAAPWEVTLDPEGLALGEHELRAVATDETGNTDPDPAAITVVHGDTTAPPSPTDLVARVDGADVTLTWTPPAAADLESYGLYRDGERIAEDVTETTFLDPGRNPETYAYTVTAADADGNESAPSEPSSAVVYALRLAVPSWPVRGAPVATVAGDGSRTDTTVRLERSGAAVTETPGTGGAFVLEGVPLVPDGNVFTARGTDAAGNRSLPSDEIVLIANDPPGPVTGLAADVDGLDVMLEWLPVAEPDLFGYLVRRDGEYLTGPVLEDNAASVESSVDPGTASRAFDGNPATVWPGAPATGAWRVVFPSPVLVERIHLRFAVEAGLETGPPARYTVLARWEGRDLPIASVEDNTALIVDHRLPAAFATDALTVEMAVPGQIAEVEVFGLDVVPVGTQTFSDDSVPDGAHAWAVTTVDRYGIEGPEATVDAEVGDAEAPATPLGLVATPEGRDVLLVWDPSPEPDVAEYAVLRDGARIGTSPTSGYRDADLPNGTYVYTVIAVDAVGNESGESLPDDATVDVAAGPPAVPVILEPTDVANPITRPWTDTDVGGQADAGSLVSLEVNGEPRGTTLAEPGLAYASGNYLGWEWDVALSPDGESAAWGQYATSVSVKDLSSGEVRFLPHGGDGVSRTHRFSPDGTALAFARRLFVSGVGYQTEVVRLDLSTREIEELAAGDPVDIAWSPDGARIAVSFRESDGTSVHLFELATLDTVELHRSIGTDTHLRWSPDGGRLAFVREWSSSVAELRVLELATEGVTVLDEQAWPVAPPSWSPDGRLLAWTTAAGERQAIRVHDTASGEDEPGLAQSSADLRDPRFSPSGHWLSFVRASLGPGGWFLREVLARHRSSGKTAFGTEFEGEVPGVHEWLGGDLTVVSYGWLERYSPEAGRFLQPEVPLVPGENLLVARAKDPDTGLTSADSEAVVITVPEDAFPNLVVEAAGVAASPGVPVAGQAAQLRVRVENRGTEYADETDLAMRVVDSNGQVAPEVRVEVPELTPGGEATVLAPWTPSRAGSHRVTVTVDPDGRVSERDETDNTVDRVFIVAEGDVLVATVTSDRPRYGAHDTASVTVTLANAGPPYRGSARTLVEDLEGNEVAVLGDTAVDLDYGRETSWTLPWSTGTTWAGEYRFSVVVCPVEPAPAECAEAVRPFTLEADLRLSATVRPAPAIVSAGAPVVFSSSVDNLGANAPLDGATLRVQVRLDSTGPVLFESARPIPTLLPGTTWTSTDTWAVADPPGRHAVSVTVEKPEGAALSGATTPLIVEAGTARVVGRLEVTPGHVLVGQAAEARAVLTNTGTVSAVAYPVRVDLVTGPEVTVHASAPASVDLAPGETQQVLLALETGGLAPRAYTVLLRGGEPAASLDRGSLDVHAPLGPPSPHAPAEGESVASDHPTLVVNNAPSAGSAARVYAFELYGDAALTQLLPGATGIAETPERTSWWVPAALAEDTRYWWRARASDGYSTSPWSAVASFTVDAENRPPGAPVPDTPIPGSAVASLQPALTVRNAMDPEGDPLVYELRLATDPDMADIVASATDVAEGLGLTSWTVPVALEEDATYYWAARARDAGGASPWTLPVSFVVDTVNESPTPPQPLSPVDGDEVATLTPALVVENATDPEGDPLVYRFEIDREPSFDSPAGQASPEVPEGAGETSWVPVEALVENTTWFWRAFADDGSSETPSVVASFFVNVANDPPGTPVLLDPVDERVVGTATPTLLLRNTTDPEDDPLRYEIEVRDASGAVVARSPLVPAGADETSWTVPDPLAEDADFTWTARASDGDLFGPWSEAEGFRVDAVQEPPSAPVPLLPANGSTIDESRPTLVVENATSAEGLALTYTFELYGPGPTLIESASGIPEEPETTAWVPSADLVEGEYEWRARASDPVQDGPWSATFRFEVRLDAAPAAPTGLQATPGDARVRLDWNASPEPDVTSYNVYRGTAPGGPYGLTGSSSVPAYDDTGLANGVVYYYVVTALDARHESPPSQEAAARPEAPLELVVEVRYDPALLTAECLLARGRGHRADVAGDRHAALRPAGALDEDSAARLSDDRHLADLARQVRVAGDRRESSGPQCHWPPRPGHGCPQWIDATIELPPGHDPESIDVGSLRLLGVVPAHHGYRRIVDTDRDGIPELRVRFRVRAAAPLLTVGINHATLTGRAGGLALEGTNVIEVTPLRADLRTLPRTLRRRSCGHDVLAVVTFASGVPAREVDASSIRLNEAVRVKCLLWAPGRVLVLKFDRSEVLGVLPTGRSVEVRVTGTLHGLPFEAVDHVRVRD